MLEKTIANTNSCNEIIEIPLKEAGVYVVALGPSSCLRVLYFRAMRANLLEKYMSFVIRPIDVISASYEDRLIDNISKLIESDKDLRGIILYLSCSEILTGMQFEKTKKEIMDKYNIPVHVFKRGPLAKRTGMPKEKIKELINKIDEHI